MTECHNKFLCTYYASLLGHVYFICLPEYKFFVSVLPDYKLDILSYSIERWSIHKLFIWNSTNLNSEWCIGLTDLFYLFVNIIMVKNSLRIIFVIATNCLILFLPLLDITLRSFANNPFEVVIDLFSNANWTVTVSNALFQWSV